MRWLVLARGRGELYFYSTTLVAFQQQRGLDLTQMFLLESVLSAAFWLADIPTSLLADRLGYRRVMVLGRVLGLAGMALFASAHGIWLFCLAEVLGGVAMASVAGCESALVYGSLPPDQRATRSGDAFTLLATASSAGMMVGLFTGSFLGAQSPSLAAYASIAPAAVSLLAVLRLPAPDPLLAVPADRINARALLVTAWRTVRGQGRLSLLSLFRSAAFTVANSVFWYNQLYFADAGIPLFLFGPLMAAATALQFVVMVRMPAWRRRVGSAVLLALSCAVPGLCFIALAWLRSPLAVVPFVAGIVAFSAWQRPLVETELNDNIPDRSRATTLSALSLVGSLAAMALNPGVGHVGDFGLRTTGLVLGGALVALGAVAPLLMRARRKSPVGSALPGGSR
jgi:MFS family permease